MTTILDRVTELMVQKKPLDIHFEYQGGEDSIEGVRVFRILDTFIEFVPHEDYDNFDSSVGSLLVRFDSIREIHVLDGDES